MVEKNKHQISVSNLRITRQGWATNGRIWTSTSLRNSQKDNLSDLGNIAIRNARKQKKLNAEYVLGEKFVCVARLSLENNY